MAYEAPAKLTSVYGGGVGVGGTTGVGVNIGVGVAVTTIEVGVAVTTIRVSGVGSCFVVARSIVALVASTPARIVAWMSGVGIGVGFVSATIAATVAL